MSTSFAMLVLSWLVTLGYFVPPLLGVGRTTDAIVLPAPEGRLPACTYGDRVVRRGVHAEPPLVLVDTEFRLPRGYTPRDLRSTAGLPLQGRTTVRRHVLDDLG